MKTATAFKKHEVSMLHIEMIAARMGKIANNIEHHGDEEITAFDIPITNLLLDQEQLNLLLDDKHACNALFNRTRSGDIEPNFKQFETMRLKDEFDKAKVRMKVGEITFTAKECKIKGVAFEFQNGGHTSVSFKLRLRPDNDKQILALLGSQNRSIKIGVAEAKVAEKAEADKTGDLFGEGKAVDDSEAVSKAQSDALGRSTTRNGNAAH